MTVTLLLLLLRTRSETRSDRDTLVCPSNLHTHTPIDASHGSLFISI